MTDLGALLLDPIYASPLGVPAILHANSAGVPVTVIDKTAGVEVPGSGLLSVGTIRPAVDVRVSEITANGLTRASLSDIDVTLWPGQSAEKTWHVQSVNPRPGPVGEASGEIRMFLIDPDI